MTGAANPSTMLASMPWLLASSVGSQVVGIVVVAWPVTPAEFGVVTLALMLIDLLWGQWAGGAGFALGTAALSGPLATMFGIPGLARTILLLSATLVVASFGAIHAARLCAISGHGPWPCATWRAG